MAGLTALSGELKWPLVTEASAQLAITAALLTPSPLGDMALGQANAPVTVVEYASMTCPHCAAFNLYVFPMIKTAYIDTGKIRFIFREFPLDIKAAAGSMIARCAAQGDSQKYFAVVEKLFQQQSDWVEAKSVDPLKRIGLQAGLSEQSFEACLKDQRVLDGIKKVQAIAEDQLKVESTPSFFINGKLVAGEQSFEDFSRLIDPLLKS